MKKINWDEVEFWVFAVICMVLLLWLIFGNSPTELFVSSAVVILIIVKMWDINEKQIKIEMGTRNGFYNMKQDMNLIKKRLEI